MSRKTRFDNSVDNNEPRAIIRKSTRSTGWEVSSAEGIGWVFTKTFPTRWKAELALKIFREGGRFSDYAGAARAEGDRRRQSRMSAMDKPVEKAIEKYGSNAVIGPEEEITISRNPSSPYGDVVRFEKIWDFHVRTSSGGVRRPHPPALYGRISCTELQDPHLFGHSCLHGPGPHEILVCVPKRDNKRVWAKLLTHARH